MERKSGLPAYLTALIPGVGYMYLGLRRKGIEALILWILIDPVLTILLLGFLRPLKWALWFYTFFDTINLASRIDKGEFIPDSHFLFLGRIFESNTFSNTGGFGEQGNFDKSIKINKNVVRYLAGCGLIAVGALSIINRVFKQYDIYHQIKNTINVYLIPILLVLAGIYMLAKNRKQE